jgi:hypothetical protein
MKRIGIFGVPRSGTSWLGHIFNSHPDVALRFQPLFSYGHKGALTPHSTGAEIRAFFDEILHTTDAFAAMTSESQRNYPTFHKAPAPTHVVFKETRYLHVIENMLRRSDDVGIVGIVRHPLAVLASWRTAPKEFDERWDIRAEWRAAGSKNQGRPEEFYGFEKWKETTLAFLRFSEEFPDRFLLVRYDELNRHPVPVTERLLAFAGLPPSDQVRTFLVESKSRHDPDPYSVFRADATDDRWREVLPLEIAQEIRAEVSGTALQPFLSGETDSRESEAPEEGHVS